MNIEPLSLLQLSALVDLGHKEGLAAPSKVIDEACGCAVKARDFVVVIGAENDLRFHVVVPFKRVHGG